MILTLLDGRARAQPGDAPVSAALNVSALQPGKDALLAVVVEVPAGFHAQSHTPLDANLIKFEVKLDRTDAIVAREPVYPEPKLETFPALGKLSIYADRVVTYLPLTVKQGAKPGAVKLAGSAQFQLCDDNMCYAPQTTKFELAAQIVSADQQVVPREGALFAGYKPPATQPARGAPPTAAVVAGGAEWSLPFAFGAAFLAGLLFNVMPCVLPVLPLKVMGFYEASHQHRSQSVLFGLVFSLGLIAVFAVLALLVLVFRALDWGGLFSHGWFIWCITALLVVLALGLMGGWNFQLPLGVYTFEPRHDTYAGNFFWGALMAILATPCTAPLLPALLLWAASHPAYVGVPAMIMVGVGMSSPYLVLSAMPEVARKFPRTGPAAELFKQMMGFMLLAAAAYFAGGRLVHGPEFWWIVVAVVAVAAMFLLARTVQISTSAAAVGFASVISVAMLGGVLWWTARITGIASPAANVAQSWHPYNAAEFAAARNSGKPVLVKFTANWCATCQVIEGTVFRQASVWDALKKDEVVAIKVDLTDSDAPGKDLLLSLNPAGGIPLTAIYPANSDRPIILASIYSTDMLLDALKQAVAETAKANETADARR
jgi:thiol:disulfide interchange protein DsbD